MTSSRRISHRYYRTCLPGVLKPYISTLNHVSITVSYREHSGSRCHVLKLAEPSRCTDTLSGDCFISKENRHKTETMAQDKILFILSSNPLMLDGTTPTGWYLPEAAHPYYVLNPHYTIEWASPQGEKPMCYMNIMFFRHPI